MMGSAFVAVSTWGVPCCGWQNSAAGAGKSQPVERPEIQRRQEKLLKQYELLEEKLFTLYQYEKDKNPTRSKLLEKAYQRSQQASTIDRLQQATGLLAEAKLKQAEAEQSQLLTDLTDLLALLQSEDRGKRIADELERYQEYLKEVERLLRIQKGLRGQTEGGGDEQRIAKSESEAADRAQRLADSIQKNEEQADPELIYASKSEEGDATEEAGDQEGAGAEVEGEGADDKNDSDATQGEGAEEDSDSQETGQRKPSGESTEGESTEGESANEDLDSPDAQPEPEVNPIRKRIANAEDRMRDAQQSLQQDKRDDAVEQMRAAEKEIVEAKKQLEETLRQLREEEVERTLAKLKGRFRKMLQREIEVKETTEELNQTAADQRATDFDIQTGKLATEQNSIATEASRALLLLREDGSSVAFPATVEELHFDMLQIAARLSAAKVGEFTLELQKDVIDTLNYVTEALSKAQKDNEKKKSDGPPPGGGGQANAGGNALVGKISELKMLRGLQDRIHQRHQRYAKTLENPAAPVATANTPDLIEGLSRLAEKQRKLTGIAQDIVSEENK